MLAKKIAVLLYERDNSFDSSNYLLTLLLRRWEELGASVEIVRGVARHVQADILIPHINLTVVPVEYREFMAQYPVVVNRHLVDISKSKISAQILKPHDSYAGPVIVKTNLNFGGRPEKWLLPPAKDTRSTLSRALRKISQKLRKRRGGDEIDWKRVASLNPHHYPIYDSLGEVPKGVFKNKNLIVEKFLPEIDAEQRYCLRNWLVFGGKGYSLLSKSRERIVKSLNTVEREEAPVPAELIEMKNALGIDYAKIDYVLRDGKVVLYDVNRTPTFRGPEPSVSVLSAAHAMADGIWEMKLVA